MKYIVINGNVVEGFNFVGPFETEEAATDWAYGEYAQQGDWTVAELHKVEA